MKQLSQLDPISMHVQIQCQHTHTQLICVLANSGQNYEKGHLFISILHSPEIQNAFPCVNHSVPVIYIHKETASNRQV